MSHQLIAEIKKRMLDNQNDSGLDSHEIQHAEVSDEIDYSIGYDNAMREVLFLLGVE